MKLQFISESSEPNASIYHVAHLWPGSFIEVGAVSPRDASDLGLHAGRLTGDKPDEGQFLGGAAAAMKAPHPIIVDEILDLPDEDWIKALTHQTKLLSPDLTYHNFRIIDRKFDEHNMMLLAYIADVNLEAFRLSMDWSPDDIREMDGSKYFKIIRQDFQKGNRI